MREPTLAESTQSNFFHIYQNLMEFGKAAELNDILNCGDSVSTVLK